MRIVRSIPPGYKQVHILADTYRPNSIKDPERLPRNFNEFLKNGENKSRLIDLIQEVVILRKAEVLDMLGSYTLFYSNDNVCHVITKESVSISNELSSNQEEADTKLVLHTSYASLKCDTKWHSHSQKPLWRRWHQCNHHSPHYRRVWKSKLLTIIQEIIAKHFVCQMWICHQKKRLRSLDSMHSQAMTMFSAFFQKGKATCWNILRDNALFWSVFENVGTEWLPSERLAQLLEEFVCLLFGNRRLKSIDAIRFQQFKRKYESETYRC